MLVSPMSLDLQLSSWVKAGAPKNGMVIPSYTMLYHEHLRVQGTMHLGLFIS